MTRITKTSALVFDYTNLKGEAGRRTGCVEDIRRVAGHVMIVMWDNDKCGYRQFDLRRMENINAISVSG